MPWSRPSRRLSDVGEGEMILDIGPETARAYGEA